MLAVVAGAHWLHFTNAHLVFTVVVCSVYVYAGCSRGLLNLFLQMLERKRERRGEIPYLHMLREWTLT